MWEKVRVGWFERIALNHVYYHMWNRSPVLVWCMRQGAQGWFTGMTKRDWMGREMGGDSGWRTHVHPWLIHVNVWQKSLQCCKVISLLKKNNNNDWLVWSPCCPRNFQESSPAPHFEGINSLVFCLLCGPVSLLFKTLSRFVIAFLSRSRCLLISWLQSSSSVILEPKKGKSITTSTFSLSICHEVMEPDAIILVFIIFGFKSALSLSSTLIKRVFSSS